MSLKKKARQELQLALTALSYAWKFYYICKDHKDLKERRRTTEWLLLINMYQSQVDVLKRILE